MLKIKAHCIKCTFKNGDYTIHSWSLNEPNEDIILSGYGTFSTKGENAYVTDGKDYELEIELVSSSAQWGGTYKILSIPSMNDLDLSNLTKEESFEILMDCTSSERIAENILNAYDNFIELILTEGKESIDVNKIKGVGEVYLNAYARELTSKYKYYHLLQEFKDYQVDITDCKALCDRYFDKENIKKRLNKYPYEVLISTLGRSFKNADNMILNLSPEFEESKQRCEYLMLSVLDINEESGSTRLNANDMYYYIQDEYNVPQLLPLIVETVKESELIYYDEKTKDVAKASTYSAECMIADFIKYKLQTSVKLNIEWGKYTQVGDFKMSEKQSSILELFCNYSFSLLVGYSGSGKTTSIQGLIKLIEDNGMSYTLLAPTGKASKRMSEATSRMSSTIHRKCLRDGEIDSDVIIIDESSMIDLPTFVMLLNCITNDYCRIVLVGDPAQLLPVGLGCIFNDIINSGIVPMTLLTEIFRYKSNGALYVATNVRQGIPFFDKNDDIIKHTPYGLKVGDNYKFIQTNEIKESVISEYNTLIKKGIKPNDILCLSPFNVGDEGTYEINTKIQSEVNPPKPNEHILSRKIGSKKIIFRLGDRILNKKNDYKALPYDSWEQIEESNDILTIEDVKLTSIFNGQEGIIRDIDERKIIVQFDEELIVINKLKLSNLLLGNAISVHSSQGSESKYVINVVSPSHAKMLNRNLLYVADTRSKEMQIDIGDMDTYNKALLIDGNEERDTFLKELLQEQKEGEN